MNCIEYTMEKLERTHIFTMLKFVCITMCYLFIYLAIFKVVQKTLIGFYIFL